MIDLISRPWNRRAGRFLARNTRWAEVSDLFDRPPVNLDEEVRGIVGSGWVDELLIRGQSSPELLAVVVGAARAAGRRVRCVSEAPLTDLPPAIGDERWLREEDTENSNWVLAPPEREQWQLGIKRFIDVAVASALLIILLPLFLVTAIAVKLSSVGPVLYRWRVLGENGRPFVGYKFRTMVRDADA
ncbi:MAG: sugar transferase, partial [bacterium]